jgi:hypothetical protein
MYIIGRIKDLAKVKYPFVNEKLEVLDIASRRSGMDVEKML